MKTITIQDATANDLATQLAGTAPIPDPTPNPTPSPAVTAPFVVNAQNPLATIVTGPDGPLLMLGYDVNTKVPWLYLRSYLRGDTTKGVYPGSFVSFQCFNRAGAMLGAVTLNAGFVDDTPGREQGDLDVVFPIDGAQANISFSGKYTPVGSTTQYPAGLNCWPPDVMGIGNSINRYSGAGFKILPVRPGMPVQAIGCVQVGAGYVPIYP